MDPLQLIVTIVDRGKGNKVARLYSRHQVFTHMQCEGTGTATSEILDILGIGSSEKDVLLSMAPRSTAAALLEKLGDDLRDAVHTRGIAFTLPMAAVSGRLAAMIDMKTKKENGGTAVQEDRNSLILVIVNRGCTDEVMATARKAGARGGTIIRARWSGEELFEQLYGVTGQTEKEVIAIVAPKEIRSRIMEDINTRHGIQSDAGAVLCALGIEQTAHLG